MLELQRIAGKDVRTFAGGNRGANFEPYGMEDVALLAVGIVQQREVGAAIGIVLNGRHLGRHAQFIAAKIYLAILFLVAATAVPHHDFAVIVTAAGALFRLEQGLFRLLLGDMAFIDDGDKPSRRRVWIKAFQSHRCLLPFLRVSQLLLNPGPMPQTLLDYKFSAYSIIFSPSASFT